MNTNYTYIKHKACYFCKIITPIVQDLVDEGWDIETVDHNSEKGHKHNAPTPSIHTGEVLITPEVLMSALLMYDMYPHKFQFENKKEVMKFVLQSNKTLPIEFQE